MQTATHLDDALYELLTACTKESRSTQTIDDITTLYTWQMEHFDAMEQIIQLLISYHAKINKTRHLAQLEKQITKMDEDLCAQLQAEINEGLIGLDPASRKGQRKQLELAKIACRIKHFKKTLLSIIKVVEMVRSMQEEIK